MCRRSTGQVSDVDIRMLGVRMPHPLILPMAVHVALTAFLYGLLTIARAPKIWGVGLRSDGTNPWVIIEPRISANLSNQFEWPLFFYIASLLLIATESNSIMAVGFAWLFIAGRILHSLVQILTSNIRVRGLVFTVNFLAVLALWVLVVRAET